MMAEEEEETNLAWQASVHPCGARVSLSSTGKFEFPVCYQGGVKRTKKCLKIESGPDFR